MTFDDWISQIFDRPVPADLARLDACWDGPGATIVAYMTRLFREADAVLAPFSDAQAAQGLWAMCSADISEYPCLLTAASVPFAARLDCLHAMDALFGRFFARRCSPHLSHRDRAATPAHVSPLNGVCYMWWDVMPLGAVAYHFPAEWPAMQTAMLRVFEHCLSGDSVACRESTLLGVMNWWGAFDETPQLAAFEALMETLLDRPSGEWPALRRFLSCDT